MSGLSGLENQLDEMLVKNAPMQLPDNARKWIAEYAWLLELVFVVLGAFAFLGLLAVLGLASVFVAATAGVAYSGFSLMLAWLSLLALGAEVVVGAMAVPKLKAMQKAGWNLAFYVTLFNFVYGVVYALAGTNLPSIIWQAITSLISLYLLFQVRSYFKN